MVDPSVHLSEFANNLQCRAVEVRVLYQGLGFRRTIVCMCFRRTRVGNLIGALEHLLPQYRDQMSRLGSWQQSLAEGNASWELLSEGSHWKFQFKHLQELLAIIAHWNGRRKLEECSRKFSHQLCEWGCYRLIILLDIHNLFTWIPCYRKLSMPIRAPSLIKWNLWETCFEKRVIISKETSSQLSWKPNWISGDFLADSTKFLNFWDTRLNCVRCWVRNAVLEANLFACSIITKFLSFSMSAYLWFTQ